MNSSDERTSIFKELTQEEFKYAYFFEDLNVVEDVSFGQRNYYRNLDAVLETITSGRMHNQRKLPLKK